MAHSIAYALLLDPEFRKYCKHDIVLQKEVTPPSLDTIYNSRFLDTKYQELLSFIGQLETHVTKATDATIETFKTQDLLSSSHEKIFSSVFSKCKFIWELDATYIGPATEQTDLTKMPHLQIISNWWKVAHALFFKNTAEDAIIKLFVEFVKQVQLARLRNSKKLWLEILQAISTNQGRALKTIDLIKHINKTENLNFITSVLDAKGIETIASAPICRAMHVLVECVACMVFGVECLSATFGKLFDLKSSAGSITNRMLMEVLSTVVSVNSNQKAKKAEADAKKMSVDTFSISADTFSSAFNIFVVNKFLLNNTTTEDQKKFMFLKKSIDAVGDTTVQILWSIDQSSYTLNLPVKFVVDSFRQLKAKGPTVFMTTNLWNIDDNNKKVDLRAIAQNIIVRDSSSVFDFNMAKFESVQSDLFQM